MNDITSCLLKLGGDRVVRLDPDWDDAILLGGLRPLDKPVKMLKGRLSQCHGNSSGIWLAFFPKYHLYTGYTRSDELWCRHSWLETERRIIETTTRRDAYFGIELSGQALFTSVICDVMDCFPKEMLDKIKQEVAA